jgi:ATP-binding cassette subfamily B protein/subfamily B ATP-binding cassette protein MsbA
MYTGSTLQQAGGSARRVLDIMKTEPEVADRPGAVALAPVRGEIVFEEVSFAYEPGRPVLKGISFRTAPGEMLALVGPTGAGKSTLVSLIPRFFDPGTGRVLIDGHDLREVQLASLRRQVALVLQEPFLFPIGVAENIAYGRPDADMAEIEAAARAANAHDFITRLPQGYATALGERGSSLSGGERQRLSIARALLKDAPILILDEPTSALDAETEHLVIEALQRLMAGRTTLIIAHRLSTVRRADRVLVLDRGELVEAGRPPDLLAKKGQYARFHALQSGTEPAAAS